MATGLAPYSSIKLISGRRTSAGVPSHRDQPGKRDARNFPPAPWECRYHEVLPHPARARLRCVSQSDTGSGWTVAGTIPVWQRPTEVKALKVGVPDMVLDGVGLSFILASPLNALQISELETPQLMNQ